MANRVLTVFQNLDKAISGNWDDKQQHQPQPHSNSYNMSSFSKGGDVIYKASDKEDYIKTKLELQQNSFLNSRWRKANVDLTVQAFNGLNNIKLMYRDAELMDAFPEIGAALDILSEESCTSSDTGKVVNIYSKSDRIKSVLDDLFTNRLNIEIMAQMIIRGMCKYGNQFMLLNIDNKNGVMGWKQLPVYNIERLENGIENPYSVQGFVNGAHGTNDKESDMSTKFMWVDAMNSSQVPFRNWQIGHFRLISNSLYLPYGCLVGDTRIETNHGYKEISKIEIGDKVWTFNCDTQKRELANVTMWMDKGVKDVYHVETTHNYIDGTSDHKILCYENNEFVYKEIGDIKIGDSIVVNGKHDFDGRDIDIDKTRIPSSRNRGIKWFDDNIDNVPNTVDEKFAKFFGFMLGDGSVTYGRIITLAASKQEYINKSMADILEEYTKRKPKWSRRDSGTCPFLSITAQSKFLGTILERMGYVCGYDKKRIPSWVYEASSKIKRAFLNGLLLADGYCFIDARKSNANIRCTIELENEQLVKDIKILCQSLGYKTSQVFERDRRNDVNGFKHLNKSYSITYYETEVKQTKCNDCDDRKTNDFIIERVKKLEYVGKKETFDITVDNDNSNFFANGIVTHNCSYLNSARRHWRMLSLMEDMMLIYRLERSIERRVYKIFVGAIDEADVKAYVEDIANNFKRTPIIDPETGQVDLRKNLLDVSQDLFIPVRDPNAPTPIDTLSAAQNLTAMDDIKFVQNKVLTALRIPRTFLNFEENAGDGANLALLDVRFTRSINRIQQAFLMELTKIASIHLYILGFEDELTNFSLTMNNPSTQAEQLQVDNIQKKISAVRDAVADPGNGIPIMSQARALREIMKWSDKEIQENLEEIRLEKALAAELEKTTQIIKKTRIFDNVDRIYGEPGAEYQDSQQQDQGGEGGAMGGMGGGGGLPPMDDGGGMPSDDLEGLGEPGSEGEGDINGAEGEIPMDSGNPSGGDDTAAAPSMESSLRKKPLLVESVSKKPFEYFSSKNDVVVSRPKIYNDSMLINEEFDKIVKSIDKFIDESK